MIDLLNNLGFRSLFFITLNACCQSLLACKVYFEKSAASLRRTPLQVTCCFSLAAFKFLFIFNLWHFNYDGSQCGPLWVQLVWDTLCFLDLYVYLLHQIKEVFLHYFFNYVFNFFLFLFSHSYDSDVGTFGDVLESSYTLLIFFEFLFLYSVAVEYLFLPFPNN